MPVFRDLFRSKSRYATVKPAQGEAEASRAETARSETFRQDGARREPRPEPARPKEVPDGLWTKCPGCHSILYQGDLARHLNVCDRCGHHFHVGAQERLSQLLDDVEAFEEWDADLVSVNPLGFPGYEEKLARMQAQTGLTEAVVTGAGRLQGFPVAVGVLDFSFFSGSMGSVVGEKLARLFERAAERRLPVVVVSGGGGGARMQEGILSLMQMAKTSQAVELFGRCGRPYISVLTNPTMGGVYASFASLGDYILAEPGALIGFAGPRIVERTIRQSLPSGFQTAEFALKHGMVDAVVERKDLKPTLARILRLHQG